MIRPRGPPLPLPSLPSLSCSLAHMVGVCVPILKAGGSVKLELSIDRSRARLAELEALAETEAKTASLPTAAIATTTLAAAIATAASTPHLSQESTHPHPPLTHLSHVPRC